MDGVNGNQYNLIVLIVAKCNVNDLDFVINNNGYLVLIVAKCNVNKGMFELLEPNDLVLIVAKCNVNFLSVFQLCKFH